MNFATLLVILLILLALVFALRELCRASRSNCDGCSLRSFCRKDRNRP